MPMPKLYKRYHKTNVEDRIEDNLCDLSLSELKKVPVHKIHQFKRVTILDLSSNKLTTLGNNFVILSSLTKIDLSKNQLVELPENFGDLHNLRHLDLYDNKLDHLPLSFGQLTKLRYLDLKGNPLLPALAKIVGFCLTTDGCQMSARNTVKLFQQMSMDFALSKDQEPEIQTENSESTTNNDDKVSSNDQLAKISKKSKSRKKNAKKKSDNNNDTYLKPHDITLITIKPDSHSLHAVDTPPCMRIYKPVIEFEESDDFDCDDDNSDRMQPIRAVLAAGTSQRASKKKPSTVRAVTGAIRTIVKKRSNRRQVQRIDDDVINVNTAALSSILLFFFLLAINVMVIYFVMFKNPDMSEWLVDFIPPQYSNWIVTKMELFRLRVGDLISEFRTPPEEH